MIIKGNYFQMKDVTLNKGKTFKIKCVKLDASSTKSFRKKIVDKALMKTSL